MLNTRSWVLWFALAPLVLPINAKDQHHGKATASDEKTFSGMVEKVDQRYCEICRCVEVTLMLKTKEEVLEVRLGPKPYLEEHDFLITRGDMIDITGLRFREARKMVVLANEIRKGGDTLNLRGKYGRPTWVQHHGHTCPVCGN